MKQSVDRRNELDLSLSVDATHLTPAADLLRRLPSHPPHGRDEAPFERRKQQRPTVSIVIPARDEEPNLPFVLPRIGAWVDEIILVDGRSQDRTREVARSLLPHVRVVEQSGRGKGSALRTGFEAARGDIVVMLDADGSTDPREIPLFVGALAAGAEFVKGTRFAQGAGSADLSLLRRMGHSCLVWIVRVLYGGRCTDLCYGYMAFWRRVLPALELDATGFEIEAQLSLRALRAGLKVAEVPSYEFQRIHGKSNLRTVPDGYRVFRTILREWRRSPVRKERRPVPRLEEPAGLALDAGAIQAD